MVNYYQKEFVVRGIKILDIGYITAVYFALGLVCATIFDNYLGKFDEKKENKKTLLRSTLELLLHLWITGVIIYIVRNIIPMIPFPLEGIYGFEHRRVKEVSSAGMFAVAFLLFQKYYQAQVKYVVAAYNT